MLVAILVRMFLTMNADVVHNQNFGKQCLNSTRASFGSTLADSSPTLPHAHRTLVHQQGREQQTHREDCAATLPVLSYYIM
jgi:hypothetical protein